MLRHLGVLKLSGVLAVSTLLAWAHPVAAAPLTSLQTFAASTPAGASQLENFLQNLTQILTGVATFIAALFIVGGGIAYTMSSGNPDRMEKAKKTIIYAVVGLIIAIAAFSIATFFGSQAQQAFGS